MPLLRRQKPPTLSFSYSMDKFLLFYSDQSELVIKYNTFICNDSGLTASYMQNGGEKGLDFEEVYAREFPGVYKYLFAF